MLDAQEISRLLSLQAPGRQVLSVYLQVPLDPAQRRGMAARLDDVFAQAEQADRDGQAWTRARRSELPAIRQVVTMHAHQWLGHSVAIFACSALDLLEIIPLRAEAAERAVIGPRPYVRPLFAELHRSPSYVAVVVDRRHAWLLRIFADGTDSLGHLHGQTVASRRFGGWHGWAAYRNAQRSRKLARQHYGATIGALAQAARSGNSGPLVVGGHESKTREFVGLLPPALAERLAGTFVIDPHTMTPARVRQLADGVVAQWEDSRERQLAAELTAQPPGGTAAFGLDACVAAANQHAVDLLMVPDDRIRPGYSCRDCGALAVSAGDCGLCGGPTRPVPDVIEELAVKVTADGGTVEPVHDAGVLTDVAARRRFPAPAA